MDEWLSYREAAARTGRSIRSINRWRRGGMKMQWEQRGDKRVRVVRLDILLAWWRERLNSDPAHQYRLRKLRAEQDTERIDP